MNSLIFSVVWVIGALEITEAEPVCHMAEIRICVNHMATYINNLEKRTIPKTEDEVINMCKIMQDVADCWNDYKKRCMTIMQTEMEALTIEGIRELRISFCSPDSDLRTKYIQHSKCLGEVVASESTTAMINRLLVMLENFDTIPDSNKIRYVCCGWNKLYGAIKQSSLDTCGAGATESAEELLSMAISSLPNVLCQGFDQESNECKKTLPPEGVEPTGRHNPFVDGLRSFFRNHLD